MGIFEEVIHQDNEFAHHGGEGDFGGFSGGAQPLVKGFKLMVVAGATSARGFCVFDPALAFPGRRLEAFAFFCDYAYRLSERMDGRKLFACDELQQCVGDERTCQELQEVLENGRIRGLNFAAITIAPNLVHNRIRGQATEVVTFRQGTAEALPWLALRGFNREEVMALPRGSYIARGESGGETRGRVF